MVHGNEPHPLDVKARGRLFMSLDAIKEELRERLPRQRPVKLLDVGTGFGINAAFLARLVRGEGEIWSVDPSPEVLRWVKGLLKEVELDVWVKLKRGIAERLPFESGLFDAVISLMTVHHLEDPARGVGEMVRTLKPGGKLFIADWKPKASVFLPHPARDIPQLKEALKIVKAVGLEPIVVDRKYWYLMECSKT